MTILVLAIIVLLAAIAALADFADTFPPSPTDPAIDYYGPSADPVAKLAARLANGSTKLDYAPRGGYLKALLNALTQLIFPDQTGCSQCEPVLLSVKC